MYLKGPSILGCYNGNKITAIQHKNNFLLNKTLNAEFGNRFHVSLPIDTKQSIFKRNFLCQKNFHMVQTRESSLLYLEVASLESIVVDLRETIAQKQQDVTCLEQKSRCMTDEIENLRESSKAQKEKRYELEALLEKKLCVIISLFLIIR